MVDRASGKAGEYPGDGKIIRISMGKRMLHYRESWKTCKVSHNNIFEKPFLNSG